MLLVSTYELGHQPLHLAVPAAALLAAGHEVRCVDTSVDTLDEGDIDWADAVACSVPMHTAMRLVRQVDQQIHLRRPGLALCIYGLYATVGTPGAELAIAGEYLADLLAWAATIETRSTAASRSTMASRATTASPVTGASGGRTGEPTAGRVVVRTRRQHSPVPARHLLPPLDRYARLAYRGEEVAAGYVEASRGCIHRCRHCPVPVVYDGRTRLVDLDGLLADVEQLVKLGARHLTFGDPDFLNGPHHARRTLEAVHLAFPDLTFDITVKVEHILRHRSWWDGFARAGCLFVTSAFESAQDEVLARLHKGHTVADIAEAVGVLRAAHIETRPSLMPFTPWTTAEGLLALFDLVARCDLAGNVDPVQFAIRLLLPPGSLLLADPDVQATLDGYDDDALGWRWHSPDPRFDALQQQLAAAAEAASAEDWPAMTAYQRLRDLTAEAFDAGSWRHPPDTDPALAGHLAGDLRPRLTESWFCCAEPTADQLAGVGCPQGAGACPP